uniref:Uncharacterized protein n=1 Tax=Ananas comosus var. bracteatus TaxID=296719 RepID=A0A6V7QL73_ANACO|nr:unnamed protein product [Ananas comosus var. bracteatus]
MRRAVEVYPKIERGDSSSPIRCSLPSPPRPSERNPRTKTKKKSAAMISILAQERVLGAALGIAFTGSILFHQRREIYRSIPKNSSYSYQYKELTHGKNSTDLARMWNKAVDGTLGQLVVFLSSRGW